ADQVDGSRRRLLAGERDHVGHLLQPVAVAVDVAALTRRRAGAAAVERIDREATVVQQLTGLGKPLRMALESVQEDETRRRLGPPPGVAVDVRRLRAKPEGLGALGEAKPAGD